MKYLKLLMCTALIALMAKSQTNYVATTANSATPGINNTMVGPGAGDPAMTGTLNVFLGDGAGNVNSTGTANVFLGRHAGYSNKTANYNVFAGEHAGFDNTAGAYNTFVGFTVARRNTTGRGNVAVGARAGYSNQAGDNITAIGDSAGYSNIMSNNVFLGSYSGYLNSTGEKNTFLGYRAGFNSTTGSGNLFIGYRAGFDHVSSSNKLYIGNEAANTIIYGDFSTGQILLGKKDATEYAFIGTRTLNVIGGILADSVRVAHVANWKDDVFSKNYTLMSLAALESYIKKFKHLPGIPAEKEVKERGIDLVEMNSNLLGKIEELTLYLIAQQKQLEELRDEISKIKNK
ncbi:MAG: hypothetical protein V4717_13865 [Bacteroidota bacterium]